MAGRNFASESGKADKIPSRQNFFFLSYFYHYRTWHL